MNDLLSLSFSGDRVADIEMGNAAAQDGRNLEKFFKDVEEIKKELKDLKTLHTDLRQKMASEHRETVQRRYYTVTGETPDEATVDTLISTGQIETFLTCYGVLVLLIIIAIVVFSIR